MAHVTPSEAELATTLSELKLSTKEPQRPKHKPKSAPVADSWDDDEEEEEEASSGSNTETETETTNPSTLSRTSTSDSNKADTLPPINTVPSYDAPVAPPPTPASPTNTPFQLPGDAWPGQMMTGKEGSKGGGSSAPAKRPEKTTAVAGRLIAAGLGVRPPKRTEEERAYDKATRERVRRQRDEERNREKVELEQAEARKRAVWED